MPRNIFTCLLRASVAIALTGCIVATPVAIAQPVLVDTCPLPQVSLPLFDATPAAIIAVTPAATTGTSDASDEEIREAVETIVSCTNSTSQADRYAVFTDRYLATRFIGASPADQPAFERMIATGMMPEGGSAALQQVSGIVRRNDGRIEVTMLITGVNGSVEDRVILARDGDSEAWLIDDVITLDPPSYGG